MPSSKILNWGQTNQKSLVDLTSSLSLSESIAEPKKKLNRRFRSPGAKHCWYWNAESMGKAGKLFTIPKLYYGTIKNGPDENLFLKKGTKVELLQEKDRVAHGTVNKIFFRINAKEEKSDISRSQTIEDMAVWLDLTWNERGKKIPEQYLMPIGSLQDFNNES